MIDFYSEKDVKKVCIEKDELISSYLSETKATFVICYAIFPTLGTSLYSLAVYIRYNNKSQDI